MNNLLKNCMDLAVNSKYRECFDLIISNNIENINIKIKDNLKVLKIFSFSRFKSGKIETEVLNSIQKELFEISYSNLEFLNRKRFNDLLYIYSSYNQHEFYLKMTSIDFREVSGFCLLKILKISIDLYDFNGFKTIYTYCEKNHPLNQKQILEFIYIKLYGFYRFSKYMDFLHLFDKNLTNIQLLPYKYQIEINLMRSSCCLYNMNFIHVFDSFYKYEIKVFSNDKLLTILFSYDVDRYTYYKRRFKGTVIFVTQKFFSSYYILFPEMFVKQINALNDINNYSDIYLTGSSKGGFAALLCGAMLARQKETNTNLSFNIHICAFSPITYLKHPGVTSMPSIKFLLAKSQEYYWLRKSYDNFNDVLKFFTNTNNKDTFIIIYGSKNKRDCDMALHLKKFCTLIPLDTGLHSTICLLPPVVEYDEASLLKFYNNAYSNEPDLNFLNNVEKISFDEFKNCAMKYKDLLQTYLPSLIKE